MIKWLLILNMLFILTGCMNPMSQGGRIQTPLATQEQAENPKTSTALATDSRRVTEYIVPAGSVITQYDPVTSSNLSFIISAPMPVKTSIEETVDSKLGTSDMSVGKYIAKLKSLKWIQGVGLLLMLFGIASFVYPPLRAIIGSVTTSLAIAVAGLGLIILPIVIVGNELLILLACVGLAVGYLFIHRYGKKSGEVEILRDWVDKNNNGIRDDGE